MIYFRYLQTISGRIIFSDETFENIAIENDFQKIQI
jgi:hypothetical protein